MPMDAELRDRDSEQVQAFLAQLSGVPPARRGRAHRVARARVGVLIAGLLLVLAGAAWAVTRPAGPLHDAEITPIPGPLTCSGVIGKPATYAANYFENRGYSVSWRLQVWGTHVDRQGSGAVHTVTGGRTRAVASAPAKAVVWDVARIGPTSVVVFTQAPHDPNAPNIVPPGCEHTDSGG